MKSILIKVIASGGEFQDQNVYLLGIIRLSGRS
jgi:hypothetical protein